MPEEIKMEYPLMEEMKKTFQQGQQQLQELSQDLKGIADRMEQGAFLGDAGAAFQSALRGPLMNAVNKIDNKFGELVNDLDFAVKQMQEAEQKAKAALH
jgi:WXG100 family type VII secretion target